jgi:hypothetical protein
VAIDRNPGKLTGQCMRMMLYKLVDHLLMRDNGHSEKITKSQLECDRLGV